MHKVSELGALETKSLEELRGALGLAVHIVGALVAREHLEHAPVLLLRKGVQVLRHPAKANRLANANGSGSWLQFACHDLEQRRLARTVGTKDAVAVAGSNGPGDVIEHARAIRISKRDILHLNDLLAQPAHG